MTAGRLAGRRVLVTGGARGIGLSYATRMLAEGADVVIADINGDGARAAASSVGPPERVTGVEVDISDEASVIAAVDQVVGILGGIDVLVNNAALYGGMDHTDHSVAYLRKILDINLIGTWLVSKAVAPVMVSGGAGSIINQASTAAWGFHDRIPSDRFIELKGYGYQLSKNAVVGLTKYMAGQLGRYNIRVNGIAPGVIATEATLSTVPEQLMEDLVQQQAIAVRLGPDDVTGTAVFFASDDSLGITGQIVLVDGGRTLL